MCVFRICCVPTVSCTQQAMQLSGSVFTPAFEDGSPLYKKNNMVIRTERQRTQPRTTSRDRPASSNHMAE